MNFLPKGYENLKTEKHYWKMSQMKEGENRFRIVDRPIAGWLDWHDKTPVRFRPEARPTESFKPESPVKAFWSCWVWDYARENLYVLEITQSSILKALTHFAKDEDWGDFTQYDLKLTKEGSGKETRYYLTPLPPKPLSSKIKEAMGRDPVNLEALYDGRDPWTGEIPSKANHWSDVESLEIIEDASPRELLVQKVRSEGLPVELLDDVLDKLKGNRDKPRDLIIKGALMPEYWPAFLSAYRQQASTTV